MDVPDDLVEVTCTREVCHVVITVPARDLRMFLGNSCPECHRGVLERREAVAPEGCDDRDD